MKVAHFGNIANVPYLLASGMKKFYGVESVIFMPREPDPISKRFLYGYESGNPYGINIIYVNGAITSPFRHIDTLRALVRERVDIGHVHQGGVIDSLETKVSRANIISHFHGSDLRRWLAVDRWRRMYYCSGLACENKILVSTPDLFDLLIWKGALEKSEHLPNAVEPIFHERMEDEEEPTIFLPTRHDESIKRTSVAFKAWKIVRKLNRRIKLKTLMWGKDFPVLYHEFKQDKRITWLPLLSRVDYVKHLRSSSVVWGQFLLGTGVTELEAMAAGKPVFHYWKHDIYDRGVYDQPPPICSYNSSQSIASATNNLLEDEGKRREIGLALKRWVLKYHSLENVSKHLYRIYKELL